MSFSLIFFIITLAIVLDGLLIWWWKRRKNPNPGEVLWVKFLRNPQNRRNVFLISGLCVLGILALLEMVGLFQSSGVFPFFLVIVTVGILFRSLFKTHPITWGKDELTFETPVAVQNITDQPEKKFSVGEWFQEMRTWPKTYPLETITLLLGVVLAVYLWRISPSSVASRFTLAGENGHSFQGFHFIRVFLEGVAPQLAGWVSSVGSLLSLGMFIPGRVYSRPRAIQAGLLIAGVTMACLGQLAALGDYGGSPVRLYLMAILIFCLWSVFYGPYLETEFFAWKLSPPWEIILLILVIALTIFTRFYKIDAFPYGIEADEGKWTAKVMAAMLDGEYRLDAILHLYSVPVGFYMQAPFFHELGPGLISGRIAVAVYSILGSFVFYWVARALLNPQAALLATTLLAISLLDLSASRYSNVETLVKLWPLLTLLLLLWSLRSQKLLAYFLAGISSALGWLTYDTVLPILAVCLLILAVEFHRAQTPWEERIQRLAIFLLPGLLTIPTTAAYVHGRLGYYQVGANLTSSLSLVDYFDGFMRLVYSLFVHTATDFFYTRNGPVFNSLLLPWLLLGLVIALTHWKQKKLSWIVIFFVVFFIPAPTLAQSPWARVYYPGYASAYLLIALGMLTAYQQILYAIGKIFQPLLKVLVFCGLSFLIVFNLYIYFNETLDEENRQIRRELHDIALERASEHGIIYFPFVSEEQELLALEDPIIWLGMRTAQPSEIADSGYQILSPETLLLKLQIEGQSYEQITVVRNRTSVEVAIAQEPIFRDIQSCYPDLKIVVGHYFDRYELDQESLIHPFCTLPNTP